MVNIGKSDLEVAPLALGGNTFGWTSDADTSFAVLDAFVEGGGNFVDSADVYSAWAPGNSGGESEEILGAWLKQSRRRDDVVVATKVAQHPNFPGLAGRNVAAAAEASLKRLGTDHIDLYYAHEEDPNTPIEESVAAFAKLQQEGKIREVGLSNFSPRAINAWVEAADSQGLKRPVALQPHYNLVFRKEYETELLPTAKQFDLGVVPYWALASGLLTGKYRSEKDVSGERAQMIEAYLSPRAFSVVEILRRIAKERGVQPAAVALKWLASQETVVAPIASARTADQVGPLIDSITLELSPADMSELSAASSNLG